VSHSNDTNFGNSVSALIGVVLVVSLLYMLTAGRFAGVAAPEDQAAVAARLAPIGKVNTTAAPAPAAPAAAAAPAAPAAGGASAAAGNGGEAIYNRLCQACHATGVAGAPLFGNKEAWAPRIALGMDALLQTAIAGKGAMPPRGTCADCSDADLKAAIEYMVSKAQ
jgi:cytochrome c5